MDTHYKSVFINIKVGLFALKRTQYSRGTEMIHTF